MKWRTNFMSAPIMNRGDRRGGWVRRGASHIKDSGLGAECTSHQHGDGCSANAIHQ